MNDNQFEIDPKYFLQILNTMDDGIYISDKHGITLWMNEVSKKSFAQYGNLIGRNVSDLEKEGVFTPSAIKSALEVGETITILQTAAGSKSLVTGHLILNKQNKPEYVIAHSRDMEKMASSTPTIALEGINSLLQHYIREIKKLREDQSNNYKKHSSFIGQSKVFLILSDLIEKVSSVLTTVLITGETGVGKNVIAQKIHDLSDRHDKPFTHINCAAIPEMLIESELFGYKKGSFTGANSTGKTGLVHQAEGGTIFLDEISELPWQMQSKLLQLLQNKTYMPIGATTALKANVRIIAATNRDLEEMVNKKEFRADLFYRLNVLSIRVPSLRERKEDIFPLLYFYLRKFNSQHNKNHSLSKNVVEILNDYDWPGNVRELENIMELLVIMAEKEEISVSDLPERFKQLKYGTEEAFHIEKGNSITNILENLEKKLIKQAYNQHKSTRKAAKQLGISQSMLMRRITKYNMHKEN